MALHIQRIPRTCQGFALVVTLSLMILLALIAVGLLSLSAVSLRVSSLGAAQAEARANARLALLIAIGELQKEMGPDMRVSAESALFDSNADTETIEGVGQSRWLASYDSWGAWLNAAYSPPGSGGPLKIADTYTPGRQPMFRRWLLSLPSGTETNLNAPNSAPSSSDPKWVKLVGKGSLGFDDNDPGISDAQKKKLHMVTRAYLTPVGKTGRNAWWIGPENHKARIDLAKRPRDLSASVWETAQGGSAEVGVGSLPGLRTLDSDAALGDKLITRYWNPYNVELHVPDSKFAMRSYLAQVHTMDGRFFLGGTFNNEVALRFDDDYARMMSGDGQDIVFKPGEFRIFAPEAASLVSKDKLDMMPGFDPQAFGGLYAPVGAFSESQKPRFQIRFSNKINGWKFNFRYGNTPASLLFLHYWSPIGDNNGGNYSNPAFHHHVDRFNTSQLYRAESKAWAYQSGVTGPGTGNSFLHPMLPRTDGYRFFNNSISMEMKDIADPGAGYTPTDTKAYCDYWDHVLLLNDALWDDYFVSSLADQTRPGASASASLAENLRKLVAGEELANARFLRVHQPPPFQR